MSVACFPPNNIIKMRKAEREGLRDDYFLRKATSVSLVHRSQLSFLRRVLLHDTHDEALLHVRYLQKGPERCGDAALYLHARIPLENIPSQLVEPASCAASPRAAAAASASPHASAASASSTHPDALRQQSRVAACVLGLGLGVRG